MNENNTNIDNRKFININILVGYGEKYIPLLLECLYTEDTEQKLLVIPKVIDSDLNPKIKIFIIQKLLSLPKETRKVIASKIEKKINK